jgi:hypothetical protein
MEGIQIQNAIPPLCFTAKKNDSGLENEHHHKVGVVVIFSFNL